MSQSVSPWPKERYGGPVWPRFEQVQELLERWQREHPAMMELQIRGRSEQDRPVYVAILTDSTVSADDKEHVLVSALHAGVERNAAMTVLSLMEWLLAGAPLAREILRRQVIVCMPIPNPDCYIAGTHGNTYSEWTLKGPKSPAAMPEAVAVQSVMDEYQFEVFTDLHGTSLDFEKYIMFEISGASSSNTALRPYHGDVIRLMDEAALAEGYPSNVQESSREQLYWGPELDEISDKVLGGRPRPYAAIYCYNLYHTMVLTTEVSWERSGLLRNRRLLQIGNEIWPGEYYPGYPVRVTRSSGYHMVTAYGQTAAARRRSRVELYAKHGQIWQGMADPFIEGKLLYVVASTTAAADRWLSDRTLAGFARRLSNCPGVDAQNIEKFVSGWPVGQNNPNPFIVVVENKTRQSQEQPIEYGLSIRVRIFYHKARILDLRLNGHPIPQSETDGYLTWIAKGMTIVQINVPPEKSKVTELYTITCEYDPGEQRGHWRGW